MHYEKLQNTIKELAEIYPEQLVTAMSVIDIEREVDALKHSSDAGHPKSDIIGGTPTQEEYFPHAPRTSLNTSGREQPRPEAGPNLDVNALSLLQHSNTPASWDERVRQWAKIPSAEVSNKSSSPGVLNTTSYPASVTTPMHDETSSMNDTKADETGRVRTQSQEKADILEFVGTLRSVAEPVLEALSRFGTKIPLSAPDVLVQQRDLLSQVQKYGDDIQSQYQIINDTPVDSMELEPAPPTKGTEWAQKWLKVVTIVCSVAERLFSIALEDQEHWTAVSCVEKWHSIADQFEWETCWPLMVAFKYFLHDEQVQKELNDRTKHDLNPLDRVLERRRLLDAGHTSSSPPRTSDVATTKVPSKGS